MNFFDISFWQNFGSNLLATLIGVALGIPAAFWINRRLESTTEKEKKTKILGMLSLELKKNQIVLRNWQKDWKERQIVKAHGARLSDEVWNAFSEGEKFIISKCGYTLG